LLVHTQGHLGDYLEVHEVGRPDSVVLPGFLAAAGAWHGTAATSRRGTRTPLSRHPLAKACGAIP